MKKLTFAAVGAALMTATLAPAAGAQTDDSSARTAHVHRGGVIAVKHLAGMSKKATTKYLGGRGLARPTAEYGVDIYRVRYRTVDAHRKATRASGLLVLPRRDRTKVPAVSYQHGTNPTKRAAATVDPNSNDRSIAVLFGAAGFGTVAPDYLGLGLGRGQHPYMDHSSEATATIDLLRAGRKVARAHDHRLSKKVRLTGFSQGGPATMAVARRLQRHGRLAAAAPVSGPYDVESTQLPGTLFGKTLDPKIGVVYLGYWLTAMDRVHDIYDSPKEMFRAPYAGRVERLFNGNQPIGKIATKLPTKPSKLLKPSAVRRLTTPKGALARAMRSNDQTCEWRPRSPVRIYAAHGDKDVAFANSKQCASDLREHGAHPRMVDVGATDHTGSVLRSMPRIVKWFQATTR